MKNIIKTLLIILTAALFFTACEDDSPKENKTPLRFLTEEYKPFNFIENSKATGLAPDLLKEICSSLNIDCEIEFANWSNAYNEVLTNENTVLFSTALNATRKDQFKWAGPIASLDWYLYAVSGNPIVLNELNDAKSIGAIGVIEGYAMDQYLREAGFTNLVYCTDNVDAITKLLNGSIDLFPSDKYTTTSALESLGNTIYAVAPAWTIKTELLYFAFNKNTSDAIVSDFQVEINRLKKNGTLRSLTEEYLNTSDFPDILQIYTEAYPPLTFMDHSGEITGYGSDIVKEIMNVNHDYYRINLSAWSNGYQMALDNPNFCLYTMDRTEIRENLFQWVGPIGANTTWIYTKKGTSISISSIDEAKNLATIGTVNSWFSTQYMEELGFTNLIYESDPEVLAQKLLDGELDAFVCTDITFPDILAQMGYTYADVEPAFSLMSSDFYIAFSKSTSATIVNQWQTALDKLKQNGTYDAIHYKWFQN